MAAPSLIRVEPGELVFDPKSGSAETKMKIVNVSPKRVGYKLFTDHTDMYMFHPKSGFVDGSSDTEVGVKLLRVPKKQAAVADHVTVVKARPAREDELDREKEWRTALPQDEAGMQVVQLKTRFRTDEKPCADEEVLKEMRRIEDQLNKRIDTLIVIARLTLIIAIIILLMIAANM